MVHVGIVHAHGIEGEFLACFAIGNGLRGLPPAVGGDPVGDEEDPRTVVGDAALAVQRLALTQQLDAFLDGLAHRGEALRLKLGGLELAGAGEVLRDQHGAEGDDGHFHALGTEAVGLQLFLEGLQAGVEFLDLASRHGAGDIQQQQAGAARLWVVSELGGGKGIGVGVHGVVSGKGIRAF